MGTKALSHMKVLFMIPMTSGQAKSTLMKNSKHEFRISKWFGGLTMNLFRISDFGFCYFRRGGLRQRLEFVRVAESNYRLFRRQIYVYNTV